MLKNTIKMAAVIGVVAFISGCSIVPVIKVPDASQNIPSTIKNAKNWHYLGTDTKGNGVYVDDSTIQDISDNLHNFIVRVQYAKKTPSANAVSPYGDNKKYNPVADHAVFTAGIECRGVIRLNAFDFQIYESNDSVIEEIVPDRQRINDFSSSSKGILQKYFCSK